MQTSTYLIFIAGALIFTFSYLFLGRYFFKIVELKNDSVTYESAKEALNRIATWTTWLTGLQTASIAAMGFLFKSHTNQNTQIFGFFTLLFFGLSIILSTWLLSSLPSIQQRLIDSKDPDPRNDIYMMTIFSYIPLKLGRFSGLVHTYFLFGVISFASFIFQILTHP